MRYPFRRRRRQPSTRRRSCSSSAAGTWRAARRRSLRACKARVTIDGVAVDVHNAYVSPGASRSVLKFHHFEAIRRRVHQDKSRPRILCGDFSAPWNEDASGPIVGAGWGWTEEILSRWNEAAKRLVANPEMRDVYRDVQDPSAPFPASHYTGRGDRQTPHRSDFIFASPELPTERCEYLSDWLMSEQPKGRLSDHAPVEATVSRPSNRLASHHANGTRSLQSSATQCAQVLRGS